MLGTRRWRRSHGWEGEGWWLSTKAHTARRGGGSAVVLWGPCGAACVGARTSPLIESVLSSSTATSSEEDCC